MCEEDLPGDSKLIRDERARKCRGGDRRRASKKAARACDSAGTQGGFPAHRHWENHPALAADQDVCLRSG